MSAQKSKPIIMFDMDGTLLDLAFDDFIWNEKLPQRYAEYHQCSLEQSKATLYQFYQQHQHTLAWYSSRFWTDTVGVDVLALQQEYQDKITMRSGCLELLQRLQQQGYRCWLVTNADCAGLQLKLENVAIRPYFEQVISSEQLGYSKEFQQFWQNLQQLHPFEPEHVVFVDDTEKVLHAASDFGIRHLITIPQPSSDMAKRENLAFPSIHHLSELFPLLDQITTQELNV